MNHKKETETKNKKQQKDKPMSYYTQLQQQRAKLKHDIVVGSAVGCVIGAALFTLAARHPVGRFSIRAHVVVTGTKGILWRTPYVGIRSSHSRMGIETLLGIRGLNTAVVEQEVTKKIMRADGKAVMLSGHHRLVAFPWQGWEQSVIDDVKDIEE
jgi:hypothetical protein